jgi:hypothetical protein
MPGMEQESARRGIVQQAQGIAQGALRKLGGLFPGKARAAAGDAAESAGGADALATLDLLQAGRRPDYCLYVGPTRTKPASPGAADMEDLLARGFDPLPVVQLDAYKSPLRRLPTDGRLADEAYATLAEHARVLLVVPTGAPEAVRRIRWLKDHDHLWRAILLMPEGGTLGTADWAAGWQTAASVLAPAGLDLPPYTAGGWLFRYAIDETEQGPVPRAATFRMIVHPNPEKISAALDQICEEMGRA